MVVVVIRSIGPTEHSVRWGMICILQVQCYVSGVVYAVAICLYDTSQCSVVTAQWIELIFGTEPILSVFYVVLEGNSGVVRDKGTSLPSGNWPQTLDEEKFHHGMLYVASVDILSLTNNCSNIITPSIDLCVQHDRYDSTIAQPLVKVTVSTCKLLKLVDT